MTIWEATTAAPLSSVYQPSHPTAVAVSADGTVAFIGTHLGVFRIYDISDRKNPRLIQQIKFYNETLPLTHIHASYDGQFVSVANSQTQQVFILSQSPEKNFMVYGFYKYEGYILSTCFGNNGGKMSIMACLGNNMLASAIVSSQPAKNRREPFADEES